MKINYYSAKEEEGQKLFGRVVDRMSIELGDAKCRRTVKEILARVKEEGDTALMEYTRKFDSPDMELSALKVSEKEFAEAEEAVDADFLETLDYAACQIRSFHEKEMEDSWFTTREDGVITGRLVRPVDKAGLYVPGGKGGSTPLVSSVLMNGIPAVIAGVEQIIMVTPADEQGRVNPALLMAAREVGISEVYKVGSAWAIGALAFGTDTIPAVDVIVGPGNQYVAEAKQQVMGMVRIDMLAGPSEVLIIADQDADPSFLAADMLAQAEHDPQALSVLLCTDKQVAEQTIKEIEQQLVDLSRRDIAETALSERGLVLLVESVAEAVAMANQIAMEHLELQVNDPWQWLGKIKHAGAIFLGAYTPEAAGDYVAGPNHVLPTMGTARIASALGVETFLKKSSVISYTRRGLINDGKHIQLISSMEGLTAHGKSVAIRLADKK